MRLFRKDLIDEIVKFTKLGNLKQDVLFYYGALLYTYTKNVFYYKYAYDNVRAGKEKFNLPFRSTFKEVYSNVYILKLFDESFLIGLLQDINPRDIKIYLHNKDVIALFRENF